MKKYFLIIIIHFLFLMQGKSSNVNYEIIVANNDSIAISNNLSNDHVRILLSSPGNNMFLGSEVESKVVSWYYVQITKYDLYGKYDIATKKIVLSAFNVVKYTDAREYLIFIFVFIVAIVIFCLLIFSPRYN